MKATAKWFSALVVGAFAFAMALAAPGAGSAEASNTTVYRNYKPSYTSQQYAKQSTIVKKGNTSVYYNNRSNTTIYNNSYTTSYKQTTQNYQNNKTTVNNNYNANTTVNTSDEQTMINLINKERIANGLQPLSYDAALAKVARDKAKDMVDNNYFSHQSPTYGSPFDQMKSNGITYRYAGENLAGASNVNTAHTNLMNSDSHRKNILNANYTKVGVGVIEGGPYGKMYVQEFTG
ncbi:CAP domain-containing protein [Desulforamulus ferrireducens]|uniref:Serine protease n=1 Tax=Desulforamulus ferrireducens TaxID=1833852 RepID=A0A1S6IZ63_9FIRM|nr:CAP domain-containing protein [Desulforamulus ferrireducens]AQS60062.1 serine protease [Desulforamulus ferrireducens]